MFRVVAVHRAIPNIPHSVSQCAVSMIEANAVLAHLKDIDDPSTITTFFDVALATEDLQTAQHATIITQLTTSASSIDVYAVHDGRVWFAQGMWSRTRAATQP